MNKTLYVVVICLFSLSQNGMASEVSVSTEDAAQETQLAALSLDSDRLAESIRTRKTLKDSTNDKLAVVLVRAKRR